MSMVVKDLFSQARYSLKDTGKRDFSDFELLEALNSILSRVSSYLVSIDSPLVQNQATLTITDGNAPVTEGLAAVIMATLDGQEIFMVDAPEELVPGTFCLASGYIRTAAMSGTLKLNYLATFPRLHALTDEIPLPDTMLSSLREALVRYVLGDESGVDAIIGKTAALMGTE